MAVDRFSEIKSEKHGFAKLREVFAPDGRLAAQFRDYEYRPGQLVMAQYVLNCYKQGGITLVEAGTGTGKSLGYLIPALIWARETGEKVVISTHTITLQEQLLNKDIPLAMRALDWDFTTCLVKGWSNYVCLFKLRQAGAELDLFEQRSAAQLNRILQWVEYTEDGSLADLDFTPFEDVWESVCAESDLCIRGRCPYFPRCFYFQARKKIQDATVLIVNHHLLFADLSIRRSLGFDTDRAVLPRYYHVIFDEAHHLEDVATTYLGVELSSLGLSKVLNRIHRWGRRSGSGGLVGRLLRRMGGGADTKDDILVRVLQWDVPTAVRQVYDGSQRFFQLLRPFCTRGEEGTTYVLNQETGSHTVYSEEVFDAYSQLQQALQALSQSMDGVVEQLEERKEKWDEAEGFWSEARALAGRVTQYKHNLHFVYNADATNYVFWLELGGKNQSLVKFCAAPIVVAGELQEALLQHMMSVVCTSATLTADGKFDYLIESLGLKPGDNRIPVPEPLNAVIIESPFDYERQALLCVPSDMPDPGGSEVSGELTSFLLDLLPLTNGRAFVLFTSYKMLGQVHEQLQRLLPSMGIRVLRQGDAPRGVLLDEFTKDDPTVLLGTDSFWEGVDVPGEALSCVVIAKLPFRVPTEPVTAARVQALESQGRNSFREYMLPQAVLKFKQGFGRLIRTKTDRGVVVVCDPRLLHKAYGKVFLNSLPRCSVVSVPQREALKHIASWLDLQ